MTLRQATTSQGFLEYENLYKVLQLSDDDSTFLGLLSTQTADLGDLICEDLRLRLPEWNFQAPENPQIGSLLEQLAETRRPCVMALHRIPAQERERIAGELFLYRDRISRRTLQLILVVDAALMQLLRSKAYDFVFVTTHIAELDDVRIEQQQAFGIMAEPSEAELDYQKSLSELEAYEQRADKDQRTYMILLYNAGNDAVFLNPKVAWSHLEKALVLAEKLNDHAYIGYIENEIGLSMTNLDLYEAAIPHYQRAIEKAKMNKDKDSEALYYGNIGIIFEPLGQFSMAQQYYTDALYLIEENQLIHTKAWILGLLSHLNLFFIGDIEAAAQHAASALEWAEKRQDQQEIYRNIYTKGNVKYFKGKLYENFALQTKALQLLRKIGNKTEFSKFYRALALNHLYQGELSMALQYCQAALEMAVAIQMPFYTISNEIQLALIYTHQGNTIDALQKIQLVLSSDLFQKNPWIQLEVYSKWAFLFIETDQAAQALEALEKAAQVYKKYPAFYLQFDRLHYTAMALLQLGQWPEAKAYIEQAGNTISTSGYLLFEPANLNLQGRYQQAIGQSEAAVPLHRSALEKARAGNIKRDEIEALQYLGDAYAANGQPEAARKARLDALSIAQAHGYGLIAQRLHAALGI